MSIQELFDLVDADADSGAMFGECVIDLSGALVPGDVYEIEGRIVDVERKHGRRAGTFDKLTFEMTGRRDGDGEPLFRVTNTFIFPRREEAAA